MTATIQTLLTDFLLTCLRPESDTYICSTSRKFLSSEAAITELISQFSFSYDLFQVLQASSPPKSQWFSTRCSAIPSDDSWGIYVVLFEKLGEVPKLYIGSGTGCDGIQKRVRDHLDSKEQPSLVKIAKEDEKYTITKVSTLATLPAPRSVDKPKFRAVTLALEAALSILLWTFPSDSSYGVRQHRRWPHSSYEYRGLCSHSSFVEGPRSCLNFGKTPEELELEDARRRQRKLEKLAKKSAGSTWDQTIPEQQETYKEKVISLYVDEKRPLNGTGGVRQYMKENYNIDKCVSTYRCAFRKWGIGKNAYPIRNQTRRKQKDLVKLTWQTQKDLNWQTQKDLEKLAQQTQRDLNRQTQKDLEKLAGSTAWDQTIPGQQETYKQKIISLYIDEKRPLDGIGGVRQYMKENHNFDKSVPTYRREFRKWGIGKNGYPMSLNRSSHLLVDPIQESMPEKGFQE